MSLGEPRYVLAFDTALSGCAAALYDAREGRAWSRVEPMMRGQSERLVPMVQEILAEGGVGFDAVDLLAVTVGPGAFTGLRLGLSAARAWGLSLKRPVMGLTTIEILAAMFYGAGAREAVRVLVETKRSDFYTQLYGVDGLPVGAQEAVGFEVIRARGDAPGTVYIGDGAGRFAGMCERAPAVRDGFEMIDPVVMARLALARFKAEGVPEGMPQPVYLRGADVSESKRVARRIREE